MTSFRTCIEVSRPKSFFAEDAISHACHVRQLAASFPFVAQAGAGSSSRPSSKASSGSGLGSISGAALSEAQFNDDVELARPVSMHCYRPQPLLAVACPALQSLLTGPLCTCPAGTV